MDFLQILAKKFSTETKTGLNKVQMNTLKIIFVLIFPTLLIRCKSDKQSILPDEKVTELKTYFEKNYIDSTDKIDSFRVVGLDTVTQKQKLYQLMADVVSKIEIITDEMAYLSKRVKSERQIASLYDGLSSTLTRHYKEEAKDDIEKFRKIEQQAADLNRSFDSLKTLHSNADSITPVAYEAACLFQLRKADMSVEKDTFHIIMNLDKNVIGRKRFLGYE